MDYPAKIAINISSLKRKILTFAAEIKKRSAAPLFFYPMTVNINPLAHKGRKLWVNAKDYFFIIFGTLLYAFIFCGLILPNKVVIGGVTGMGTLVYFTTGIPVAITQYAINLILLAFAFRFVGKQFVLRTIFGATCLSLFIGILQPIMMSAFPNGLVPSQPFMSIMIAGFLGGLALGTIFVHNGSTGGTDIVGAVVAKKTNISVGRTMLYVDFCIISSSYFLFHTLDTVVYGLVILFLHSYVCDQIINSNRRAVQFFIISPHWIAIADAINTQAHRGCTVVDGLGWYSKHHVKLLIVVARRTEAVTIFRIAKSVDPNVFITQNNVSGAYGHGFDEIKVSIKKKKKEEELKE